MCQFDRLPDQSLYYDVTWYVDDTEVLTNQTVSSNSSDLALLTGSQMLAKGKQANSMVFQLSFNEIQKGFNITILWNVMSIGLNDN